MLSLSALRACAMIAMMRLRAMLPPSAFWYSLKIMLPKWSNPPADLMKLCAMSTNRPRALDFLTSVLRAPA